MNTPTSPQVASRTLFGFLVLLLNFTPLQTFGKSPSHARKNPASCVAAESSRVQTQAPTKNASASESPLIQRARALWEQNKLPSPETFQNWIQNPSPDAIQLAPVEATPLPTREIVRRATAAYVRVGWVFQCSKCSNWHTNLAGGYAIAPNAVATAAHVLSKPERMKEGTGYPIAVRGNDEVLVISGVLGADPATDAAIVRLEIDNLQPLPVTTDVQVGDSVFCLSEPGGQSPPYFSAGIVNRFLTTDAHTDAKAQPNAPKVPRINVSTDWAPGSSGSAVLDAQGNAIGHVGSISAIADTPKGADKPSHHMNLHWAVPAGSVLQLARPQDPQKNEAPNSPQPATR